MISLSVKSPLIYQTAQRVTIKPLAMKSLAMNSTGFLVIDFFTYIKKAPHAEPFYKILKPLGAALTYTLSNFPSFFSRSLRINSI